MAEVEITRREKRKKTEQNEYGQKTREFLQKNVTAAMRCESLTKNVTRKTNRIIRLKMKSTRGGYSEAICMDDFDESLAENSN